MVGLSECLSCWPAVISVFRGALAAAMRVRDVPTSIASTCERWFSLLCHGMFSLRDDPPAGADLRRQAFRAIANHSRPSSSATIRNVADVVEPSGAPVLKSARSSMQRFSHSPTARTRSPGCCPGVDSPKRGYVDSAAGPVSAAPAAQSAGPVELMNTVTSLPASARPSLLSTFGCLERIADRARRLQVVDLESAVDNLFVDDSGS